MRVGYLDMSLDVADSAEATILVDFMTGGRLTVRGTPSVPLSLSLSLSVCHVRILRIRQCWKASRWFLGHQNVRGVGG